MNLKQIATDAAQAVRDENRAGYNTAAKVGGAMIKSLDYVNALATFNIPSLQIEYRVRGFIDDGTHRVINITCPLQEGHPIFLHKPRIVLMRKKIVSGNSTMERTRRIKYVEPGPKTLGSGSINNELSSLRDFEYSLRTGAQKYSPTRSYSSASVMTLDALINPFVSIDWDAGELKLFVQKGFKILNLMHTAGEPKQVTADFAIAVRIDNPEFTGNLDLYPHSKMFNRTPRYLYGPLAKFKMGYKSIKYDDDGEWAYRFEPILIL